MLETLAEILLASLLALVPMFRLLRRTPASLGRRDASLSLHRLRLREVDRDREIGLIAAADHGAARLEIERRLLAEADSPDRPASVAARRWPIVLTLLAVPVAAFALYDIGGHPGVPAQPIAERLAAARQADQQDDAIITELRTEIAVLPPGSPRRREGELLLGQAEAAHGDWAAAAGAFGAALSAGPFDPQVAVEAAEARTRADGHVGPDSAALFKRAIAAAPPDAPWRTMAEERIAESEHAR